MKNIFAYITLIASGLGLTDALYLTANHYQNNTVPCSLTSGCETVLTSSYATVLGIPVALFGALFYFAVFAGTLYLLEHNNPLVLSALGLVAFAGLFASLFLLYIQISVLEALCTYCLISLATTTISSGSIGVMLYKERVKIRA